MQDHCLCAHCQSAACQQPCNSPAQDAFPARDVPEPHDPVIARSHQQIPVRTEGHHPYVRRMAREAISGQCRECRAGAARGTIAAAVQHSHRGSNSEHDEWPRWVGGHKPDEGVWHMVVCKARLGSELVVLLLFPTTTHFDKATNIQTSTAAVRRAPRPKSIADRRRFEPEDRNAPT